MKLYFSPLACSLAARIAIYEAGATASFVEVDGKTKALPDGSDFRSVHALGLVPALDTEAPGGELLTENVAVLKYLADRFPEARLAPADAPARVRLDQWLGFITTELHKAVYVPLLDDKAPEGARAYALSKADVRLAWAERHLQGREFLLDAFSVADALLFAVLSWSVVTPIQLSTYPALAAYHARLLARPSIARAFAEERELYARELARHAAA